MKNNCCVKNLQILRTHEGGIKESSYVNASNNQNTKSIQKAYKRSNHKQREITPSEKKIYFVIVLLTFKNNMIENLECPP